MLNLQLQVGNLFLLLPHQQLLLMQSFSYLPMRGQHRYAPANERATHVNTSKAAYSLERKHNIRRKHHLLRMPLCPILCSLCLVQLLHHPLAHLLLLCHRLAYKQVPFHKVMSGAGLRIQMTHLLCKPSLHPNYTTSLALNGSLLPALKTTALSPSHTTLVAPSAAQSPTTLASGTLPMSASGS